MNKLVYSGTSVPGKCLLHYRPKKKKTPTKSIRQPPNQKTKLGNSKKRMRRIFRVWASGTVLQIMWILKMNPK